MYLGFLSNRMTELGMCSGFVVEGCQCFACVQGLQAPDANWALKSFALCCLLQYEPFSKLLLLCCDVSGTPSRHSGSSWCPC